MEFLSNFMSGVTSMQTYLARIIIITAYSQYLPYQFENDVHPMPAYDFIVVGAGSSGSVVAARLSEVGVSVLLLEAGPSAPPESIVPGFGPLMVGGDRDWRMRTKSQKNTQFGYNKNCAPLPLGKTIGGGSTLNGMQYVRGSPEDYDYWEKLGNTDWGYSSVLPYFKKSEDFREKVPVLSASFHGRGGPFHVEGKKFKTPLQGVFFKAGKELGFNRIDSSGPRQIGFAVPYFTIRNGLRLSVSEAFLKPVSKRMNLLVKPNAMVTKILFDEHKKAYGVKYYEAGKVRYVEAKREIILSAGAINTPKLLMLSGVGPKDQLEKFNIHPVAILEGVGRNLNDHHTVNTLSWTAKAGSVLPLNEFSNLKHFKKYAKDHKGFFATPFAIEANAWVNVNDPYNGDWPDVQLFVSSVSAAYAGDDSAVTTFSGLKSKNFKTLYGPLINKPSLTMGPMLARPKSRGRVTLRSTNPKHHPIIDPNFLSHPDDMKTMVKAIKFALSIGNTKAMKKIGARFHAKPLEGCKFLPLFTDVYWRCYIRHLITTFWHPTSTCKMAPYQDPMGVVTPRLRLRQVSGVRIADASVMPQVTTGNTMATCVMIGERAADFIKQDWGLPVPYFYR